MKKALFFLFALPTLFLVSCDKDDADPCQTNVASLAGTYRVTAAKYQATATAEPVDVMNTYFQACQRDDTQTLNADGTWLYTDAGELCGGNQNGTWTLTGNTVTINGQQATITSFDCSTLIISRPNAMVTGDRLNVTLTKQP